LNGYIETSWIKVVDESKPNKFLTKSNSSDIYKENVQIHEYYKEHREEDNKKNQQSIEICATLVRA
jgi:hypothetical protein